MSGEQMGDLVRVREAMRGQIMDLNEEVEDLKRSKIKLVENAEVLEKSRNIFRDQNKTLRDQNKALRELVDALTVSLRHITQGVV